ncbi:EAL domain-containing protein [bacterium]|nr:EAL domain-containing protein [bacterium]
MQTPPATIAILTDDYLEYQKLIVDPMASFFENSGFGTLCITGHELDPSHDHQQDYTVCNAIYEAARNYNLDGIVCLSGTLVRDQKLEKLAALTRRFTEIPVVSFGTRLDGVPSVFIEEDNATRDLYEHLLSQRAANKLAFVTGKTSETYSIVREKCFRAAARRHGYSDDKVIVVNGNCSATDTYNALIKVLDQQPDIDIIAAANDHMAESVLRAVTACGLNVPADVLITGFDDTFEATRVHPAITTVRQPLGEASSRCAELLVKLIRDKQKYSFASQSYHIALDAELVVRGSTSAYQQGQLDTARSAGELSHMLASGISGLSVPEGVDMEVLGLAFWKTMNEKCDTLEICLDNYVKRPVITPQSVHWWNNVFHQMQKMTENGAVKSVDQDTKFRVISAITSVRQHLWTVSMDVEFSRQRAYCAKASMQLQMSSCSRLSDLLDTMGRLLQQTMIQRCFFVCYLQPGATADSHAQLLYAYIDGVEQKISPGTFSTSTLLPVPFKREIESGLLVQMPISAGSEMLGYLLLDPEELDFLYIHGISECIGNALRNQNLIQQLETQTHSLQTSNKELVKLANHDSLTGLPNRLNFNTSLQTCISTAFENRSKITLLFIDLDGFKLINDTLGHHAGDCLLHEIGVRMTKATRDSLGEGGFVARVGGDEFTATIVEVNSVEQVDAIVARILNALASPYHIYNRTINISASIGVANFPSDADNLEALIKNADLAMYSAKEKGKNRAVRYKSELSVASIELMQMDNDMRDALANGDIYMHYQPRVDIGTGKLCAVEALMRWSTQTLTGQKHITPDLFIAVAEKTGFIAQLDAFALDESCRQARVWELAGTPVLVAVNISVVHLQQDGFVDSVISTLDRHKLPSHLLELEITESAMMTQVEDNVKKLHNLREHGIQLSIDDFGTGYSSLNYLKQLPVNNLKIDKSFIPDQQALLLHGSANAAIIKSIIGLGISMDFQIIAEGIETDQQRELLSSLGCHEAQGFLFAHPGPATEISKLFA